MAGVLPPSWAIHGGAVVACSALTIAPTSMDALTLRVGGKNRLCGASERCPSLSRPKRLEFRAARIPPNPISNPSPRETWAGGCATTSDDQKGSTFTGSLKLRRKVRDSAAPRRTASPPPPILLCARRTRRTGIRYMYARRGMHSYKSRRFIERETILWSPSYVCGSFKYSIWCALHHISGR